MPYTLKLACIWLLLFFLTDISDPEGGDGLEELVRHFLIEPTPTGVRLKGYKNESVFGKSFSMVSRKDKS